MRLQDRPTHRATVAVGFSGLFEAARAVRAIAQAGPLSVQPARARPDGGARSTAPATAATRSWSWASSPPIIRSSLAGARPRACADHGGRFEGGPDARPRTAGGAAAAWRQAFIRMPYARELLMQISASQRHLRDRDHLGSLRGVPRPGQGRDRAGDRARRPAGRASSPAASPTSIRMGRRPTSPSTPWAAPRRCMEQWRHVKAQGARMR